MQVCEISNQECMMCSLKIDPRNKNVCERCYLLEMNYFKRLRLDLTMSKHYFAFLQKDNDQLPHQKDEYSADTCDNSASLLIQETPKECLKSIFEIDAQILQAEAQLLKQELEMTEKQREIEKGYSEGVELERKFLNKLQMNLQMKGQLGDLEKLVGAMEMRNTLGYIYELTFENDFGMVNGKIVTFQNAIIIAEIFGFFLHKYPDFKKEYRIDLRKKTLTAIMGDHDIPISCSSEQECVRWLSVLGLEIQRFGIHVSDKYFKGQQRIPFEIIRREGRVHVNNVSLDEQFELGLKYMLYDVKYLIAMQFYVSESRYRAIESSEEL